MPKRWEEIGVNLHEDVKNGIKSLNFPTMTPIQASTIPQLVNKKDVVAEAVTGSGKTLAFVIPLLEILKRRESEQKWKKHEIGALVISPTRELALQIHQVVEHFLEYTTGLSRVLFVGGNCIERDLGDFAKNGGNIVICTPGRFEDLLTRKSGTNLTASLKSLEILVLDEADRLLDYGFQSSLDTILSYLPKQRRTGLFSATQTKQVQDLIRAGLRNPVLVSVSLKAQHSTPESLDNYYIVANNDNKLNAVLSFLRSREVEKGLLFLPTCACVDYWSQVLPQLARQTVLAIHGKMKEKRKKILEKFKSTRDALLLCTDVMARGIDIPAVDWVLQWDPPSSASAFVHRVGRTARQGRRGSSAIFLLESEQAYVDFIERNQRVRLRPLPDTSAAAAEDELRENLNERQMQDRDLMERATRAFVSHVRAYSKHECSLLLKVKELPLGKMAAVYGLLQLPKMPELRSSVVTGFKTVEGLDVDAVAYKDKAREAARLAKLAVYRETGAWPGSHRKIVRKSAEAWSLSKVKKVNKKEKRMKRQKAKEDGKKRKRKGGISEEDLQELARDVALIKKFKKKKLDSEQFDKEFGIV